MSPDGKPALAASFWSHPSAIVDEGAMVGAGTKIWHQSQVMSRARVGVNCKLGKCVYVDAGVRIGDRVKIQNLALVYHGVTVEDGVLTIFGERRHEIEEKGKKYHRIERSYGSFMRSFTLPEDADGTKISAEYKDGVLKVHLPKSEKAKPKSIEVKVS